jgi:spore cortex formation protein SpoVR/YcgB (stage V sporulation)
LLTNITNHDVFREEQPTNTKRKATKNAKDQTKEKVYRRELFLPAKGEDEDTSNSEEKEEREPPVDIFLFLKESCVGFC